MRTTLLEDDDDYVDVDSILIFFYGIVHFGVLFLHEVRRKTLEERNR